MQVDDRTDPAGARDAAVEARSEGAPSRLLQRLLDSQRTGEVAWEQFDRALRTAFTKA
jgi:hypothetical protein